MTNRKITKVQREVLSILAAGGKLEVTYSRTADTGYDAHIGGLARVRMPTIKILIDKGLIRNISVSRVKMPLEGVYVLTDTGRAAVAQAGEGKG